MRLRNRFLAILLLATFMIDRSEAIQNDLIRVNTRLVEVTVVVRNDNGPVADLTAADFTVLDNGKPQKISVFSLANARTAEAAENIAPLPPGVVSNLLNADGEVPRNLTVILFDLINTPTEFQPYALRQLIQYLAAIREEDRVALYLLGHQLRIAQDFTDDRQRLVEAAESIKDINLGGTEALSAGEMLAAILGESVGNAGDEAAGGSGGDIMTGLINFLNEMSVHYATNQALATTEALETIAEHLRGLPGRKNLIWMSAGFAFTPTQVSGARLNTANHFGALVDKASRSLAEANVAMYSVDVRGLINRGAAGWYPETMVRFADATGGRVFRFSNDIENSLRTAVFEGEVSYTLGFYPPAESFDGRFHNIDVRVNRRDVDVYHRSGYYALEDDALPPGERRKVLETLLGSPFDATDVTLIAQSRPDPERPGNFLVKMLIGMADLRFERRGDRQVATLNFVLRADSSPSKDVPVVTQTIDVSDAQLPKLMQDGLVLERSIPAFTGDRLRIIAQDAATGFAGSVWLTID